MGCCICRQETVSRAAESTATDSCCMGCCSRGADAPEPVCCCLEICGTVCQVWNECDVDIGDCDCDCGD